MQGFIHAEWRHLAREADALVFKMVVKTNAPQQKNKVDCGVFLLGFAEAIASGRSVASVAQENITHLRRRLTATVELRAPL
jgi:Ulp1 family protease